MYSQHLIRKQHMRYAHMGLVPSVTTYPLAMCMVVACIAMRPCRRCEPLVHGRFPHICVSGVHTWHTGQHDPMNHNPMCMESAGEDLPPIGLTPSLHTYEHTWGWISQLKHTCRFTAAGLRAPVRGGLEGPVLVWCSQRTEGDSTYLGGRSIVCRQSPERVGVSLTICEYGLK